mmetsp:Transcript_29832/g.87040  ORF Transcript_29832/g.87040 Transcript_29832/m.87040 type:complete len:369 (-) Transcript_29832:1231-2337(-)
MNPITSYATMLRQEPRRGQRIVPGATVAASDDAQVAAILLTSLSTIAEREVFSGAANGRTEAHHQPKKQHPLLDSKPSTTSMESNISLETYLQSCRLNKIQQQRARAVSIESYSINTDPSYFSPQAVTANTLTSSVSSSPLSMPSALVTPSSSPVLGSRTVGRSMISALPRVIQLSPKAIADSVAGTDGVKPAALSAGFEESNQIPELNLTKRIKSKHYTKSKSIKVIVKKKQSKNIVRAKDGSDKMLIMKRFCWRDFPELENILVSNRREYLSFSSRNYSPAQKNFNNSLTASIIKTAEECGYKFSPQHFDFSAVRDRIRCFYKSYVQGEKKRLFSALAAAANAEESRAIKKEIAFLDSRSSGTRKG